MKTIRSKKTKRDCIEAIRKAARRLECKISKISYEEGFVVLFHEGGLLSFGNKIYVRVTASKLGGTNVTVRSESAATIQVIDWGLNSKFENSLVKEVKAQLAQ